MNIQSLITAIRANGKSTTTLTRKGIELAMEYAADGRDLSACKEDMKACKKAYESANNGLRWASSPLYKAIKTACKRLADGDFILAADESSDQAATRYVAEMAAADMLATNEEKAAELVVALTKAMKAKAA